jgi:hypothetical protein
MSFNKKLRLFINILRVLLKFYWLYVHLLIIVMRFIVLICFFLHLIDFFVLANGSLFWLLARRFWWSHFWQLICLKFDVNFFVVFGSFLFFIELLTWNSTLLNANYLLSFWQRLTWVLGNWTRRFVRLREVYLLSFFLLPLFIICFGGIKSIIVLLGFLVLSAHKIK